MSIVTVITSKNVLMTEYFQKNGIGEKNAKKYKKGAKSMKIIKINGHEWEIEIRSEGDLLREFRERVPEAQCCMGLTFYKGHKIWIANNLCEDERRRTMIHELTHAYLWEMGFYNADFNNDEMICDFTAGIYEFLSGVLGELEEE